MLGNDDPVDRCVSWELHTRGDDRGGGRDIERFGCSAGATGVDEHLARLACVFNLFDMCPHGAGGTGEGLGVGRDGLDQRQQRSSLGLIKLAVEQGEECLLG